MEDANTPTMPTGAEEGSTSQQDEHDVEFRDDQRLLPHVELRREQDERRRAHLEEIIGPRIDAHLTAAEAAVKAIDEIQRYIADRTDLALDTDSRQLAVWLL